MFAAEVFDSKIIDEKSKFDGTCFVLSKARHTLVRMVSKRCQILDEFLVCYSSGLGKSVHTAGDIGKDVTIDGKVV